MHTWLTINDGERYQSKHDDQGDAQKTSLLFGYFIEFVLVFIVFQCSFIPGIKTNFVPNVENGALYCAKSSKPFLAF